VTEHINGFHLNGAPEIVEINQAAGMVSVQLGVSPALALAAMQDYAHRHGQHISRVAADVIARRLRFPPTP